MRSKPSSTSQSGMRESRPACSSASTVRSSMPPASKRLQESTGLPPSNSFRQTSNAPTSFSSTGSANSNGRPEHPTAHRRKLRRASSGRKENRQPRDSAFEAAFRATGAQRNEKWGLVVSARRNQAAADGG